MATIEAKTMTNRRPWGIHTIMDMVGDGNTTVTENGVAWVRAVPLPYYGRRILKAWWVLTGRAEAVVWPEPGDLEDALGIPQKRPYS
jgi:hypothetical protein